MKSRFGSLFLILVLLSMVVAGMGIPGGWGPIGDVKDPYLQEIAKFAVTEYNKISNGGLVFESILSGESQVVDGVNYRFLLKAKNGDSDVKYEAVVYVRAWENYRELTSFNPVA